MPWPCPRVGARAVRRQAVRLLLATAGALPWACLAAAPDDAADLFARSADARFRAEARGSELHLIDTQGEHAPRVLSATARGGGPASAITLVHACAARRSFLIGFATLRELWEISLDPAAEPVFDGYVHDYRMGEAIALPGFLNPRRTPLEAPLQDLRPDERCHFVLGRAVRDDGRAGPWHLYQMDARRRVATFAP